jgi:hypothetical protein
MTQCELDRELARVTGETLTTIRNRGFSLVEPPELEPLIIDWDQIEAERRASAPGNNRFAGAA